MIHLPAVAEVETFHPLPRRAPIRLNGFAYLLRQTQQERRIIIELVWRASTWQRDRAVEREGAKRTASLLRVPLVRANTRNVGPEANIVRSFRPAEVQGVSEVRAGDVLGKISLAGADRLIAADRKQWNAGVTDAGPVRPGDA